MDSLFGGSALPRSVSQAFVVGPAGSDRLQQVHVTHPTWSCQELRRIGIRGLYTPGNGRSHLAVRKMGHRHFCAANSLPYPAYEAARAAHAAGLDQTCRSLHSTIVQECTLLGFFRLYFSRCAGVSTPPQCKKVPCQPQCKKVPYSIS